ncbi:MAG TPA: hypothetical protein VHG35_14095 [Gemmatimonadales bacterium]|nr:hypothetical protein [Gemmatimonadales bacterium]
MTEADIRHGQEIRADVRGVRVQLASPEWFTRGGKVKGDVFFCTMGPVQVRRVSIEGDGGPLPDRTVLDGLRVPGEGTYDLLNVLVRSNGDLRLIVDEASRVETAAARPAAQPVG